MTSTITVIDAQWAGRKHTVAPALVETAGGMLLVDPGPQSTLAAVLRQLQLRKIAAEDLRGILLTHIHLDHAGATGDLVRMNAKLPVYVHSKGAGHMADPSRLLASAERLWPDGELRRLFGETQAVPRENLRVVEGGEVLDFGGRKIAVAYTPGHASHHVSYFDEAEGVAFVGDTGGIRILNGEYIMPAAPPPDIDLALWDASFARILEFEPGRLYLTHFGFAEKPEEHLARFGERLHQWRDWVGRALKGNAGDEMAAFREFEREARVEMEQELAADEVDHYVFAAELRLSFRGLARSIEKGAGKS